METPKKQEYQVIRLRDDAEKKLVRSSETFMEMTAKTPEELVHELRVHQIELEMMNEELRRASLASEEDRDRYAALYDFAPIGYFTFTRDALISEVNLTGASMLGVERGSLLNRRFKKFVSSEDSELWDNHFVSVLLQGVKQTCDLTIRRADDSVFYARLESIRRESSGEEVVCVAMSDITDHKWSEAALRESEKRYNAIYNNTPVMLHSINTAGRLISVSNYWLEVLGYERNEVIGRKLTDFFTEESARYAREVVFPLFLQNGFIKDISYQIVKKSGEIIDTLLSAISEKDKQGNIIQSLDVIIDITARKQAKEEVKVSETRYRRLFESAKDGILILDAETGMIVNVNRFLSELLGYSY